MTTIVRVKGVKRYCVRGRWFTYHRKTGTRVRSEFGTGAFFAELAAIENKLKRDQALPGTLGLLFASYKASPTYADLAPATKAGYGRMMGVLQPLHEMPLVELTPQFIAQMRDRLAETRGRRLANYVMAVVSVACEHGKEHGIFPEIRWPGSSGSVAPATCPSQTGHGPGKSVRPCSSTCRHNCVCLWL